MAFKFPRGVIFPTADEIPSSPNKAEILRRVAAAQIDEGYTLKNSDQSLFDCYAEVNVSSERIWSVFGELATALLPLQCAPLWGLIDDQPRRGRAQTTDSLLQLIGGKKESLAHNCLFQFGLISETEEMLEEIIITPTKHFQVWTSQGETLSAILARYEIPLVQCLEFIDQYPRVTRALHDLEPAENLMEYFVENFA